MNKILFSLLLYPIFVFSHDITGKYKLKGETASGEEYSGKVIIRPLGDNFEAVWFFDGDLASDLGTGVVKGDCVSFGFYEGSRQDFGTQLYSISCEDGQTVLQGSWARLGSTEQGEETLTKVH